MGGCGFDAVGDSFAIVGAPPTVVPSTATAGVLHNLEHLSALKTVVSVSTRASSGTGRTSWNRTKPFQIGCWKKRIAAVAVADVG